MTNSVDSKLNMKKKRKYRVDYVRILLIICFVYFSITFVRQQFRINEYKVQEEYYQNAITEINEEKLENEELMAQTNTAEYVEQAAREKLGLVKPYEKIFMDINK